MKKYSIGIDIGGTNIKTGLIELKSYRVFSFRVTKTSPDKNENYKNIMLLIKTMIKEVGEREILGIGIGVIGCVTDNEIVFALSIFPWKKPFNLAKDISRKVNLPVKIDNDVNLFTLAEFTEGAAKGFQNVLGITIGTGIGAGLIVNGALYHGSSCGAGEVGHMIIEKDGKSCKCGKKGCWETYCSATGIEAQTVSKLGENRNSQIWKMIDGDPKRLNTKIIFDAAKNGDAFALEIVDYTVEYISLGLSNLINILNPEIVIIGGGVSLAGDILFRPLKKRLIKHTLPFCLSGVHNILPSKFKNKSGIIGCAILTRELLKK